MMSTILDRIIAAKRLEIAAREQTRDLATVIAAAATAPPPRDFLGAVLAAHPIALIAEIKRASPSQGIIRADFDPGAAAQAYAVGGATCLSVLTDTEFFGGSLDDLIRVRSVSELPILRKDFVLAPYQIYEARAAGADAILLIAECLDDPALAELHELTLELGMTPLVELYDETNLERVLRIQPRLVGVNNRDLRTFQVDLDHTLRVRHLIPWTIPLVSESGIAHRTDVARLIAHGVQAMLVGQSLMTSADIATATRNLLATD